MIVLWLIASGFTMGLYTDPDHKHPAIEVWQVMVMCLIAWPFFLGMWIRTMLRHLMETGESASIQSRKEKQ